MLNLMYSFSHSRIHRRAYVCYRIECKFLWGLGISYPINPLFSISTRAQVEILNKKTIQFIFCTILIFVALLVFFFLCNDILELEYRWWEKYEIIQSFFFLWQILFLREEKSMFLDIQNWFVPIVFFPPSSFWSYRFVYVFLFSWSESQWNHPMQKIMSMEPTKLWCMVKCFSLLPCSKSPNSEWPEAYHLLQTNKNLLRDFDYFIHIIFNVNDSPCRNKHWTSEFQLSAKPLIRMTFYNCFPFIFWTNTIYICTIR